MDDLGNGIFRVESDSNASITYLVDIDAPIKTCSCTAYAIKRNKLSGATGKMDGGWCKHLDRVLREAAHIESKAEREDADEVERQVVAIKLRHLLSKLEGQAEE